MVNKLGLYKSKPGGPLWLTGWGYIIKARKRLVKRTGRALVVNRLGLYNKGKEKVCQTDRAGLSG